MNQINRNKIQALVTKKGLKRIMKVGNKIFWREDLVIEALNLVEK